MKINDETADLIFQLEHLIGKECYNPHSYDGYTGDEGCSFRYPVYVYPTKDSKELEKFRGRINDPDACYYSHPHITAEMVRSMRYKFGANCLYIGDGIYNVLDFLEKRYGIDFTDMESKLKSECQSGDGSVS